MPKDCTPRTNHPELQRHDQIRTPCPNLAGSAYVKDGGTSPHQQISIASLTLRLAMLDLGSRSPIRLNAEKLAAACGLDPVELLHMAICRAAKPKASRPDIPLVPYLTMLMRSIASGIAKARRRAAEHGVTIPLDYVHEQVPSTGTIQDPVRTIQRAMEQDYFAGLLQELNGGDPLMADLIDAIGKDYRGKRIQRELGVGTVELASLRRKLKRKACHIVAREGLCFEGNAPDGSASDEIFLTGTRMIIQLARGGRCTSRQAFLATINRRTGSRAGRPYGRGRRASC